MNQPLSKLGGLAVVRDADGVSVLVVKLDGTATPITIPGSVEINNDIGNPIPITGQAARRVADSSLVRPANSDAASVNTALGASNNAVMKFTNFFPVAGGQVLTTGARLMIAKDGATFSTTLSIRAYLFADDPSAALAANGDGGVFKLLQAQAAIRLGYIDFTNWSTGGAGSDMVEALGDWGGMGHAHLAAAAGSRDLWAILVATGSFQKISGAAISLEIGWAGL